MAKSKKHTKRPAHRAGMGNVPTEARYINVTTLDDDMLARVCKLSGSRMMDVIYLVFGIIALVSAALVLVFLHANPVTAAVMVGFGCLFLYQRQQLPIKAAKQFGKELDKGGEGARTRTLFFTAHDVGTVDDDGSAHTFPYSSVERVVEDDRMYALVLRDEAGVVAVSKAGFKRGTSDDFGEMIRRRVDEANTQLASELRPRKHL